MPRITKRLIDSLGTPSRRSVTWDDRIPGYGVLALPSGVRSFIYDYRNAEGRKRRITIAKAGAMTPDQARDLAFDLSSRVRAGEDPLEERQARRNALTVSDLLDRYLDSARFASKATSTQAIDQGRIRRHLRPLLGRTALSQLSPDQVRKALADIKAGRTAVDEKTGPRGRARVTGGPTTARDTIGLLRAILNWAVEEGYTKENPAAQVKLGPGGRRTLYLDDPDHYRRLFETLSRLEAERRIRPAVADAICVIALTGARKSEIAACRWRHIDLEAGQITLAADEHKTGRRTSTDRTIALPAAAAAIIARQERGQPDDYVFRPAKSEGGAIDLRRPWRLVRTEADLPEGIGLHGLRHSLASWMALNGGSAGEIMGALGHRTMAAAQRYVHFAEQARRQLAERAAAPALAGLEQASAQHLTSSKPAPDD